LAFGGMPQTEIADFVQALGKNVLEKIGTISTWVVLVVLAVAPYQIADVDPVIGPWLRSRVEVTVLAKLSRLGEVGEPRRAADLTAICNVAPVRPLARSFPKRHAPHRGCRSRLDLQIRQPVGNCTPSTEPREAAAQRLTLLI